MAKGLFTLRACVKGLSNRFCLSVLDHKITRSHDLTSKLMKCAGRMSDAKRNCLFFASTHEMTIVSVKFVFVFVATPINCTYS